MFAKKKSLFAVTIFLCSTMAYANNLEIYRIAYDDQELGNLMDASLNGMAHGFLFANAILIDEGREALFCIPSTMILNVDSVKNAIDSEIYTSGSQIEYSGDTPLALIALESLRSFYPCKS